QAARTPAAAAIRFRGSVVTYAELDRRADRLAHRLCAQGIGPEVPVAIFLERSPEVPVALLGVLKAGGAFLPIDPTYPAERIAYVLADARVPLVLTQEHLLDRLPEEGRRRVLCLDRPWPEGGGAESAPESGAAPDHLAYIVYTSGSTGRPKG